MTEEAMEFINSTQSQIRILVTLRNRNLIELAGTAIKQQLRLFVINANNVQYEGPIIADKFVLSTFLL